MATLQEQARALGDPTRHAIFRYLADAAEPIDVAELTEHFELNHNAIRQHLAKLLDAQLVVESSVQSGGPGRPRLVYEIDPGAESRWGVVGPYERLSLLLTEIIRTGDTPIEVGRRVAKEFRSSGPLPDDVLADLSDTMARLGFEPDVRRRGNRVDIVLGTCPFASTALADPGTVCSLHLGLAEGLTEGTEIVIDELVAKDPRRAQCRLRLHVEPDGR
jgi:predicted ArsR family transcriptional regulator